MTIDNMPLLTVVHDLLSRSQLLYDEIDKLEKANLTLEYEEQQLIFSMSKIVIKHQSNMIRTLMEKVAEVTDIIEIAIEQTE